MARLILQAILFVTLISALYGAPQNPSTPRHDAVPPIATLDAKPKEDHPTSTEESKIRPARTPHHDGTDHDHKDEHPAEIAKVGEHVDHGSSTTPKSRPSRDTEEEQKKKDSHEHPVPLLTNLKDEVTSAKPRTARAAEKDEKHEDSHDHTHPSSLAKDSHENKKEDQARPARATEEEKKSGVHDQPIPIPPTLKETHHEATHDEEKKETPKQKRETDKSDEHVKDEASNEESSDESDGHHAQTKGIVTPEHPHLSLNAPHDDSDSSSSSSSSEEHKAKSS